MGQIVGGAAKPKRCNLNKLSQLGTPAAGEYILVSSDNSMNAAGQGNFDCYIEGNGTTAATALELKSVVANTLIEKKDIPHPSIQNGLYVRYDNGVEASSGVNSVIRMVDVSALVGKTIYYSRVRIPSANGYQGIAFYDANGTYISGKRGVLNASAWELELDSIVVPTGAAKVSFTCPTSLLNDFQLYYSVTIAEKLAGIDAELGGLEQATEESIEEIHETIGNPSGTLTLDANDYCGLIWDGSKVTSANSTYNGFLVELTEGVNYTLNSSSNAKIIFSAKPTVGTASYMRIVGYNFVAAEGEKWLLITVKKSLDTHVPQSIDYTSTGLYSVIENIGKTTGVAWTNNTDANNHIAELYINPDYYVSGIKFKTLRVKKDGCTIMLYDSSDNLISNFTVNWSMPQSYPVMPYSELLFPINRNSDLQLIGYIKFIYTGTDYAISSVNYILDEEIVTDLNNSKTIKAVYENDSEGVLFGDSLISYPGTSRKVFVAYLTNCFKMHFWDAGCGGCTMAYRTAQGTDYYDSFTFVKLADLFVTGVMDENQSASHNNEYALAMKNLLSVNKSKRLFVINEYGINDYNTGVIAKGDYFIADNANYNIESLDKTTLLGAMSYGIARLINSNPDIHYCQVTTPYVVYDGVGYGDMEKTGTKGKFSDWCDDICKNASKLGVPYVKGVNLDTVRNFFTNQMEGFNTVDGNHTNEFGAYRLAIAFAQVFERMM